MSRRSFVNGRPFARHSQSLSSRSNAGSARLRSEPNRLLTFLAEIESLRSLDTLEVEKQSRRCRAHYDPDLRLRRVLSLFNFAAQIAFQFSGLSPAQGLELALSEIE